MFTCLKRFIGPGVLALVALSAGCKESQPRPVVQPQAVRSLSATAKQTPPPVLAPTRTAAAQATGALQNPPVNQAAAAAQGAPKMEDVEERRGPFTLAGENFTAVLHSKRLPGKGGPDSEALASLEIVNAAGAVQYQETFPLSVENGEFSDSCSVGIQALQGTSGNGLLLDTSCEPSAPMSGGPWQILGLLNGKLAPIGKQITTQGELGAFAPGATKKLGSATQILPDVINVRVWTGYFFAVAPVDIDWNDRKVVQGQHCFYQTGHGMAEEGCEMPVDGAERASTGQDMTFVRLFAESNERSGTPEHVVVKKDSKVEILGGKVLITWQKGSNVIDLCVGNDVWLKVRIDGKEGWIHTDEDLNAIGLYVSG